MIEIHIPKVVNTHHFGGIGQLPAGTQYIGRPSVYGNAFSSQSGKYSKEECVALHRVDLYQTLIQNPDHLATLRQDLQGKDLACWCKQPKRIMACHGDTYLHVLSPELAARDYRRNITVYLMDDIRLALTKLADKIRLELPLDPYLMIFIRFGDLKIDFIEALRLCRKNEADGFSLWFFLAAVAVDIELAAQDSDPQMIDHRIEHAMWRIQWYLKGWEDRDKEPSSPHVKVKKS